MRLWRVLALSAGLVSMAAPAGAQMFSPVTRTLANGLTVVVVENHRAPIASHMVWYRVGAADEPPGKSGIAHFLEHLMFKGTPDVPPGEFSKIIARHGGRDNAFTSSDYTAYYQDIAADRLDLAMKLEADRMRHLTLDEDNVRSELEVVKEERRSRTDNDPAALLRERLEALLYLNHPYRRPVIGWPDEIAGLTREDALAFYRRWYAPNNAVVVVAGDVAPDQVFALAEAHYGPLAPETLPPRHRAAEPPPAGARRLVLNDARVEQPSWIRIYTAPSRASAADKAQPYALEVLAEILSGGATARLNRILVVERALATVAHAWYDADALDQGSFGFAVHPRPGVSPERLEQALEAEIARLLKDGVTEAEVSRAKAHLKAQVAYARDDLHTATQVLGQALSTGQSVADVEAWPQRIAAVSVAAVTAAARAVLVPDASATGLLLPATATAATPAGAASARPAALGAKEPQR